MSNILLIDGDQFLFKACAAVEVDARWDEHLHILSSNAAEAWDVFRGSIDKVKDELDASAAYLAFSGKGNFRHGIYPAYKGGRSRKPLCYGRLYERAHVEMRSAHVDGLEADDLMGIWATGKFKHAIIVSDDKDMQTLPAKLYRDGEVKQWSEDSANAFWMTQTLTGDPTDGYGGCPKIGAVKAEKLLSEFFDDEGRFHLQPAWEAVVRQFEAAGLTADDALLQARLARILRAEDWDSERKEVKLWHPR
jgi:DNA polymerase-1